MTLREVELLEILSKFYIEMMKDENRDKKLFIVLQIANDIEELFKKHVKEG